MVSTRKAKYKFTDNERVLCYEPDPTKAKVLYDSKVLGVVESKDKRGKRLIQYKIHFQGWNSSWDRRVNENYVLKDTEENRQLQKDLAEKAQLQLAAYLYRRERKKRSHKESNPEVSPKIPNQGSSEDNSSCSTSERNDGEFVMRDDCDTESFSSSVESTPDEDRVMLKVGEKIKQYLDYDYDLIIKNKRQHNLPARVPVVTILENFVKQSAMKLIFCSSSSENLRRRNSNLRGDKREKDLEKLQNSIALLKEVADGLRIYFDFTLKDYLLYKEEKDQASNLLSEENLKNFTYIASERQYMDFLNVKSEALGTPLGSEFSETQNPQSNENSTHPPDENSRRRLRSYKNDEFENYLDAGNFAGVKQENCFSSIASTSSGSSTPHTNCVSTNVGFVRSVPPLNTGISVKTRDFLQNILSWQIIPSNAAPEPSMIFGAIHLARLMVKLPDFLNASTMSDERLKVLLSHLDSFLLYLEAHKEWFGEHNYKEILKPTTAITTTPPPSTNEGT